MGCTIQRQYALPTVSSLYERRIRSASVLVVLTLSLSISCLLRPVTVLPLCVEIMDIERWNKRQRITRCLNALKAYGGLAEPMLPKLAELEKQLQSHKEANGLQPQIELLRQVAAAIRADKNPPKLRSITGS